MVFFFFFISFPFFYIFFSKILWPIC